MLRVLKLVQDLTKVRIVWIPIFDYPELWAIKQMEEVYEMLAKGLEWVSVINPHKSVASCFVRFVKEKWFPTFQIGGDPIIVSLDRHGRIVHHNAMYMILMRAGDLSQGIDTGVEIGESIIPLLQNALKERTLAVRSVMPDIDRKLDQIVGNMERVMIEGLDEIGKQIQNTAIYTNIFTSEMEKHLWKTQTWCLRLVVGAIESKANKQVDENHLSILFGGNNIKWVKTFVFSVLSKICFNPLQRFEVEMVFVGSNMKVASMVDDKFKMFDKPDEAENLLFITIFWSRLQNLFLSRIKFLDETHGDDEESDEIAKGLKLLLAYEGNGLGVDGWAMLCKGNEIDVFDLGEKMLTVVNEYEKWKESAIAKGFDKAFKDFHHMLGSTSQHHPCCTLEYPSNFHKTPKNVECPQCCRNMQKLIAFRFSGFKRVRPENLRVTFIGMGQTRPAIEISGAFQEYPWKRNFYKPSLVSIGPEYSKEVDQVKDREYKKMYLKSFLKRAAKYEEYKKIVENPELMGKAKHYYEETAGIAYPQDDEELVEMLLIDGCFVVEFVLKCKEGGNGDPRRSVDGKKAREDMLLFENQLPFEILTAIYHKTVAHISGEVPSFIRLVKFSFASLAPNITFYNFYDDNLPEKPMNLLHVVHSLCVPNVNSHRIEVKEAEGAIDDVTNKWLTLNHINTATELQEVGLGFKNTGEIYTMPKEYAKIPAQLKENKEPNGISLFDITFSSGEMRIPCFKVDNSTELFFRNMIALEQQCCQVNPKYYTDYARLMSHLVKGNKDITFLRKNGTIHNLLGEDGKVAYMFNNLSVEIDTSTNFYFASVYTAVNGLCRNRRHVWKQKLKKFFYVLWKVVSITLSAISLLLLAIQEYRNNSRI
nr:protein SIEVE ELEMENT OCCLUSION B-like [Ipomoea batatas]